MSSLRGDTILGIFDDQAHALKAIQDLRRAGFTDDHLGLTSRQWIADVPDLVQVKLQRSAGDGAVTGAVVGGGLGAAAGAVAVSMVPLVGPVLAGGLLLGALGGAALGAAVGTYAGPFIALGLHESDAQRYAQHVEAGRTVVMVRTHDRKDEAQAILDHDGAYDDSMRAKPE